MLNISCRKQFSRRKSLVVIIVGIAGVLHALVSAAESPKTKTFTFVQLCDPQLGMSERFEGCSYADDVNSFRQAVKQINALKPDFVVICGDLVHSFSAKSIADFLRVKNEFTVPCYCVAGNHDVGEKPTAAYLQRYREAIGKDYYSFEHKGYTFVIANTQLWNLPLEGESKKHHDWVVQTLKEAKKRGSPVFMAGHYPLYVKNLEEKEDYCNLPLNIRKKLLPIYVESGVVAVLSGHTHKTIINNYQGIQLVTGEVTSKSLDHGPLGFRLWLITSPTSITHEMIPLEPQDAN